MNANDTSANQYIPYSGLPETPAVSVSVEAASELLKLRAPFGALSPRLVEQVWPYPGMDQGSEKTKWHLPMRLQVDRVVLEKVSYSATLGYGLIDSSSSSSSLSSPPPSLSSSHPDECSGEGKSASMSSAAAELQNLSGLLEVAMIVRKSVTSLETDNPSPPWAGAGLIPWARGVSAGSDAANSSAVLDGDKGGGKGLDVGILFNKV